MIRLAAFFFLNDILDNINSDLDGILTIDDVQLFLLLFADDAVDFSQDPKTLQSILNDIENYCISCGLKLNTNKTKIMIFEAGGPTHYDFTYTLNRNSVVRKRKLEPYAKTHCTACIIFAT